MCCDSLLSVRRQRATKLSDLESGDALALAPANLTTTMKRIGDIGSSSSNCEPVDCPFKRLCPLFHRPANGSTSRPIQSLTSDYLNNVDFPLSQNWPFQELIQSSVYTIKLPSQKQPTRVKTLTDLNEDVIGIILSKLTLQQQIYFATAYPQYTAIQSYQSCIKRSLKLCYTSTKVNVFEPRFLEQRHFYSIHNFDWMTFFSDSNNTAQKLWAVHGSWYPKVLNVTQLTLVFGNLLTFSTDLFFLLNKWASLTELHLITYLDFAPTPLFSSLHWHMLALRTQLRHLSLELSTENWNRLDETILIGIILQLRTFNCNLGKLDHPTALTAHGASTQFKLIRLLNPEVIQSIGLLGLSSNHLIELSDLAANFRAIWSKIRRVVLVWDPYFSALLSANISNFFESLPLNVEALQYLSIIFGDKHESCFIYYLLGCLKGSRLTELSFSLNSTKRRCQFHLPNVDTIPKPLPSISTLQVFRLANFEVNLETVISLMPLFPHLRSFIVHYPNSTKLNRLFQLCAEGFEFTWQPEIQRDHIPMVVHRFIAGVSVKFYFRMTKEKDRYSLDWRLFINEAKEPFLLQALSKL